MSGSLASIFAGQPVPGQPTGTDTNTSFPLWQQQQVYGIGNAAYNLAAQPYSPYPGQQVATPSAPTLEAQQLAQSNVGNYGGALSQAMNLTGQASQPIGAQQIDQYLNPYTQNVIGGLQQAANTNLIQNQLPAIQSQFVGAGQAASPQQMQAANNALYQSNQALDQSTSQALQSGYQGALSAAQQEQSMQQTTGAQFGQLGALTQQLGAGDVGQLAAAGQTEDTYNQANINAAMNNFYAQQQWPYQNLSYASNIIRGQAVPSNTMQVGLTSPSASSYTASPLAAGLGTTLGASAIGNGLNLNAASLYRGGGRVRRPRAIGALSHLRRAA